MDRTKKSVTLNSLALAANDEQGWVKLLPAGEVIGRDARQRQNRL